MIKEQIALTIRTMEAADWGRGFPEALTALSPMSLTEEQAFEVFQRRDFAGIRTYVAVLDDQVIGTATLLLEPKFIHGGGIVGHIEDVAVSVTNQQHGIGAALVKHLVDVCRNEGCYKVILDCADKVMPFYEKIGFRYWENAMRIDL